MKILITFLMVAMPLTSFSADANRGKGLYKKCISCHGKQGEGKKAQKAPKLAGQYEWYTVKQLQYMKSKKRINKAMNPYVKNLNDKDFADLAAYIKTLK